MPIESFLKAGPTRVHAGEVGLIYGPAQGGKGRIYISKGAVHGINDSLWAVLKIAVDTLGIGLNINSIDTGKHVPTSRHYDGRAVDINQVWEVGSDHRTQATTGNPCAVRLLRLLAAHGFAVGHENGPHAAVLLGPCGGEWNQTEVDHSTHMHVSVYR